MGLLDSILGAIGGNATPSFGTPPFNPSPGTSSSTNSGFNWGQFLSGVAPIATGVLGLISANSSSKDAKNAAAQANALAAQIYNQNRIDSLPWLTAGTGAINQLAYQMGIQTPGSTAYGRSLNPGFNPNTGTNALANYGDSGLPSPGNYESPAANYRAFATQYPGNGPRNTSYSVNAPNFLNQYQQDGFAGSDSPLPKGLWQKAAKDEWQRVPEDGIRAPQSSGPVLNGDTGQPVAPNGFGSLNHDFNMEDFYANMDPGYGFRLAEGTKALERSAAAKGSVLGGGQQKALARYSQGFASNEYGNAFNRFESNRAGKFNRLAAVSGIGQTQANTLANLSTNYGNTVGDNLINSTLVANNARQSGYGQLINGAIGSANALNNPLNALAKYYQQGRG